MRLAERGAQQAPQLLLVLGRRDDQVGQLALDGQREHALVARAVLAHQPGAVDADDHRARRSGTRRGRPGRTPAGGTWSRAPPRAAGRRAPGRWRASWRAAPRCPRRRTGPGTPPGSWARPGAGGHARGDGDDARVLAPDRDELVRHHRGVVGRLPSRVRALGGGRAASPSLRPAGRPGPGHAEVPVAVAGRGAGAAAAVPAVAPAAGHGRRGGAGDRGRGVPRPAAAPLSPRTGMGGSAAPWKLTWSVSAGR